GRWSFVLQTDGSGYKDLIIEAGGFRDRFSTNKRKYFVTMNGANVFNFTIKRVPNLVKDTLALAGKTADEIDYFIFHQANQFIIKHLVSKLELPEEKIPLILKEYGNTGGVSLPLTLTVGGLKRPSDRPLSLMLLGYGAGLSWGSALVELEPDTPILNIDRKSRKDISDAEPAAG
ncbi:MAG: 3-oxoacyl-[acyl-carrier-protein] synthase III C-terminal domain-containing protein, partial [bacterium]